MYFLFQRKIPTAKAKMPKLNLESSDKKVFSVDVEVAKKSITLQDLMENFGIEDDDEGGDLIPIPDVDAANLERLLQWAEEHKDDPPAPTDDETKNRTDNISDSDKEFFNMDQAALLQLIHAANFMNMPDLLLTACKTVANIIKERTVPEIREYFHIENDFTPEQEEHVRQSKLIDWFNDTEKPLPEPRRDEE